MQRATAEPPAVAETETGNTEQAIDCFERLFNNELAIALSPDSAGALYNWWGNALAAARCPKKEIFANYTGKVYLYLNVKFEKSRMRKPEYLFKLGLS